MPTMSYYFSKHPVQFQSWHPWQWWVLIGIFVIGIAFLIFVIIKFK